VVMEKAARKTGLFSLVLCLAMLYAPPGATQEDARYRRCRILAPVIQYHLFYMSTAYFPQFAFGGDHIFVDYIGQAFALEEGSFGEGEGVEVELNDPEALQMELSQLSREQIASAMNDRRDEIFSRVWNMFFEKPEVQGEETVETSAGRFKAFRVRDVLTRMGNVEVDYWISSQVPGNLVKIRYRSRENGAESSLELSQITKSNVSLIDEHALVRKSPGQGDTSYYHLRVQKQGDVFIEATDLEGSAEAVYYGTDSTYRDWLVSSEGNSLNVECYFVEAGTDLYFSVADLEDEFSLEESGQ